MKRLTSVMLFAGAGAGAGYLYYYFFGCTGACPITSSPVNTMIWFGILGLLLGYLILPEAKSKK